MSGRTMQKLKRYEQWWEAAERRIFRIVVVLFLMLYAVHLINFVLVQRGIGFLDSSVSQLEGVAVAESQTQINTGTIELTVTTNSDYRMLQIYVNGDYYRSFDKKSISITVKNNDIIEISGINSEYPATIKISSTSNNIISPKLDSIIRINKGFVQAGRIRLK